MAVHEPGDRARDTLPVAGDETARVQRLALSGRRILDHLGLRERLEEIRDYVWRGGSLEFRTAGDGAHPTHFGYELVATWETAAWAAFEGPRTPGLAVRTGGVAEGQWQRVRTGYWLAVGIELDAPRAVSVRSHGLRFAVPYLGRPETDVQRMLDDGLARYRAFFFSRCQPVPRATRAAAALLSRYGV